MNLSELGERICIIGMSSNGKSTLAYHLGNSKNLPVFYLDQLAHEPHTNWMERDRNLFQIDHDEILVHHEKWIIEGNYQFLMPQRFTKATSIIWLDYPLIPSLLSYFKRTLFSKYRYGKLEGAKEKINWNHIHFMIFKAPKNRKIYQKLANDSPAKLIHLHSFSELNRYKEHWNLD